MTTANDIRGVVFKNGPATLMARIVGPEGDAIAPSDVALLHYSVLEVDHSDHDTLVPVEGHDNVELDPDEMFYDELVTGPPWTMDDLGYNFRHDLAIADPAATTAIYTFFLLLRGPERCTLMCSSSAAVVY